MLFKIHITIIIIIMIILSHSFASLAGFTTSLTIS